MKENVDLNKRKTNKWNQEIRNIDKILEVNLIFFLVSVFFLAHNTLKKITY